MTMYDSIPSYLTLDRKMRLEKALKAVQGMNGSKDLITSLMLALDEYKQGINFDRNV